MATIWEKTAVNIHTRHRHVVKKSDEITLADLGGEACSSPSQSTFFVLMQFLVKIIPYNRVGPYSRIGVPRLGYHGSATGKQLESLMFLRETHFSFAAALFKDDWPFSRGFCEMTGFIGNLCSIAAVLNLMMVSIDR